MTNQNRRRRGRPMRLPGDATPIQGMQVDSAPRVSWLLATTRLYADDPVVRRRDRFAGLLTAQGLKADPTRISRWESGSARVPDKVITGYDVALGRPGRLLTVATGLRRALDPGVPDRPLVFHDLSADRAGPAAIVRRIRERRHSGLDWSRLGAAVEAGPGQDLADPGWPGVCAILLSELLGSRGLALARRYEAARTLIRDPRSQPAMVKAIGTLVTDPGAQAIDTAVSLLQEVTDPHAIALLLRMRQSPDGAVRRGAAWAIAAKLARGHLEDDALDALAERLPILLVRRDPVSLRSDAVDIIAALPPQRQEALLREVSGIAPINDLRAQLRSGELIAPDRSHRLAGTIAQSVESELPADQQVESDEMLARLVREALMHVHRERRHHAAVLLAVSPYATTLAEQLLTSLAGQPSAVVARALAMLAQLGAPESIRGRLLTWSAHHPDPWLRGAAIAALAHLDSPLTAAEQRHLANLVLTGPPALRRNALYTLGRTRSTELDRIAESAAQGEREIATWWIESGTHVDDEAVLRLAPAPAG